MKINLSYNQIEDLSGFQALHHSESRLSQIEIHGNRIQNLQHALRCLVGCVNLRQLSLAHSGASNPACNKPGGLHCRFYFIRQSFVDFMFYSGLFLMFKLNNLLFIYYYFICIYQYCVLGECFVFKCCICTLICKLLLYCFNFRVGTQRNMLFHVLPHMF